MKTILLILILCAFLYPQDNDPAFLNWGDRKLEWSDFKGTVNTMSSFGCELKYYISYSTESYKTENASVYGFIAESSIDRYLSWAKDEIKNEQYLLYNQVIFNIVELYSRYLQRDLNTVSNLSDPVDEKAKYLLRSYNSKCSHKISEFQNESAYGAKNEIIMKWTKEILKYLQETPNMPSPVYDSGNHEAGMNLILGYGTVTQPSDTYLNNNFNLIWGFDYSYRPLQLQFYLSLNAGINSIKKAFSHNNKVWDKGLTMGFSIIYLSVGYPIIKSDKYKVTPFAGFGVIELAPFSTESKYEDYNIYKGSPVWGLNIDYTFYKLINIVTTKEKNDFNIRYSFYVFPFNINNKIKGLSFNFNIGFDWYVNFLK